MLYNMKRKFHQYQQNERSRPIFTYVYIGTLDLKRA